MYHFLQSPDEPIFKSRALGARGFLEQILLAMFQNRLKELLKVEKWKNYLLEIDQDAFKFELESSRLAMVEHKIATLHNEMQKDSREQQLHFLTLCEVIPITVKNHPACNLLAIGWLQPRKKSLHMFRQASKWWKRLASSRNANELKMLAWALHLFL